MICIFVEQSQIVLTFFLFNSLLFNFLQPNNHLMLYILILIPINMTSYYTIHFKKQKVKFKIQFFYHYFNGNFFERKINLLPLQLHFKNNNYKNVLHWVMNL